MIQRVAAAILIVYSTLVIQRALPDLPERIPTRFDLHGHPTASSRPETLWLLLAAQALIVALFLAVPYLARYAPQRVNLGRKRLSDFAPDTRAQILKLIEDATGWMAVGFALFLTILTRQLIRAAMDPRQGPTIWLILLYLVAFLAVFGYYTWKYMELEKSSASAAPLQRTKGVQPPLPRNPGFKP
ncbi:MAG: hypothetical protein HY508_11935 [Acidobacteria bacterium]|nr:hypothetical protein [Acidobacteriota bacterium]